MMKSSKRLLVEGENDQLFFEACCSYARLQDIQIDPPLQMGASKNGKNNAIALLPDLISQMEHQSVTHLALVVDADQPETDGLGFVKTWDKITQILAECGYIIPSCPSKPGEGICFAHNDGFPPIGLWIMPDNRSNGFLEDFIKKSLVGPEKNLFERAERTVKDLPEPKKFKAHHTSKAEVASYMAWQAVPGQGMHGAVGAKLLNFEKGLGKQYIDWLRKVFVRP
jgi:hypothetical protein